MCEVTSTNFEEKYSEIIENLHSANFIAIDCEFSGLFDDDFKYSLFDTPKIRFHKLQNALQSYAIVQFGLSTFKYNRSENSFSSSSYTFYIKPTSILGSQKVTWLMGSVDFLCKYNFNFNKFFYDGIPFLTKSYEAAILKMIEDGSLVTDEMSEEIQKYCSKVAEWYLDGSEDEMILKLNSENFTFTCLLQQEIRTRYSNLWTYFEGNCLTQIRIKKVSKSQKQLLISNPDEKIHLKKKLFDSILGFSRIIKELENFNKPIIGHNIFIDLIMIYKQFYNTSQLPYKKFKKAISETFSNIYDTKTISFRLREMLSRENTWTSNILSELYHYLKEGKGAKVVIYSPQIHHQNEDYIKEGQFHDAGFDSFCTGFCFIKMAHIFSLWDREKNSFLLTSLPTNSSWLLGAVNHLKNHVNISRSQVHYVLLDGEDPVNTRPGLLYIQSKTKHPLDVAKISKTFAKYGSVDIQLQTKYKGLMAVTNRKQLRAIIDCAKNHNEFQITEYNSFRSSFLGKSIFSITVLTSFTLLTICAMKSWLKLSQ